MDTNWRQETKWIENLDESCKTFLLVTAELVSELSYFGMKHTWSVDTFQCKPNKLTIWLGSVTLSLCVMAYNCGLLDAQLLKLKFASDIQDLAILKYCTTLSSVGPPEITLFTCRLCIMSLAVLQFCY